jgi:hypothetical protein
VPATPFLGRKEELASVVTHLGSADVRLLTLTGVGGSGKTRLALQSAAEVAERFPGGVSWVSLSPLTDASLVAPSVVQVLGAQDVPEGRLDLAFAERGSRGRVLVLVDNCEHLLPGVAQPIAAMRDVPDVTVLATSRERLQLQGEQVFEVPPLSETDGVRLFVSRASAVGAQVSATAEVEELCERLDQLPLALELAAARTYSSRRANCSIASAHVSICSRARVMSTHASRRYARRLLGRTSCSRPTSGSCFAGWPSSGEGARSKPLKPSATQIPTRCRRSSTRASCGAGRRTVSDATGCSRRSASMRSNASRRAARQNRSAGGMRRTTPVTHSTPSAPGFHTSLRRPSSSVD